MKNLKQKFDSYIIANDKRRTPQRYKLISECEKMETFDIERLLNFATENKISKASVYFFIELLVEMEIIKIQPRYVWNKDKNI